jgi:hypothetical protein
MSRVGTRTNLLRACYSLLIPIARFLLRNGISFREFSEIGRIAFVEVAGKDYGIRGRPTNVSRVSAMTGIGRKEVKRIRELQLQTTFPDNPRVDLSPLSDVLHRWFTDPAYLKRDGKPKTLQFRRGRTSFTRLVKESAGDLPAGAIKVELLRCGAVSESFTGKLTPKRRYVVREGLAERLVASMVFGLRALASTIAHNCAHAEEFGRIERFIESNPLSDAEIAKLKSQVRQRISVFADDMDDFLSESPRSAVTSNRRIGVGVYYYEDDT